MHKWCNNSNVSVRADCPHIPCSRVLYSPPVLWHVVLHCTLTYPCYVAGAMNYSITRPNTTIAIGIISFNPHPLLTSPNFTLICLNLRNLLPTIWVTRCRVCDTSNVTELTLSNTAVITHHYPPPAPTSLSHPCVIHATVIAHFWQPIKY